MQLQIGNFPDNPIFNNFVSTLTDNKANKKNGMIEVKGRQNNMICQIFFDSMQNNVLYINKFIKNIQNNNQIDNNLKTKACNAAKKSMNLFIDFQIDQFKNNVGGSAHKNGQQTKVLAELYKQFLNGNLDNVSLYQQINHASVSGPAKNNAKKYLQSLGIMENNATLSTINQAVPFKLTSIQIGNQYQNLNPKRTDTSFEVRASTGGAVNVGYDISLKNSNAKIGVMIAANSGLPGGAIGKPNHKISLSDLSITTQEESIWANAVLTACQDGTMKPEDYHNQTIGGSWGMAASKGTMTKQGIDFTISKDPEDYNQVFLLKEGYLSQVSNISPSSKDIVSNTTYQVVFAFADSVNANKDIGTAEGTMQRTLNKQAVGDYGFFKECVKQKLRSALDGMASEGVTHALVARLSCGVYAGQHKKHINGDYYSILKEILDEPVGPNGEKRGCYFEEVIIPDIQKQ